MSIDVEFILHLLDSTIQFLMILVLVQARYVSETNNAVYAMLSLILTILSSAFVIWLLGAAFLAMIYIIVYLGAVAVLFLFVVMMLKEEPSPADKLERKQLSEFTYNWIRIGFDITLFVALFFYEEEPKVFIFALLWAGFLLYLNFFYINIISFVSDLFLIIVCLTIWLNPLKFYTAIIDPEVLRNSDLLLKSKFLNYLDPTTAVGELLYFEHLFLFVLAALILLIALVGSITITLQKPHNPKSQQMSKQTNKDLKNSVALYKINRKPIK